METGMPTYNLTRAELLRIAQSAAGLFHRGATFGEKAATDGQLKVIVVRNPAGHGTPYISLRFPGDLLDRYEALPAADRTKVGNHIIAKVRRDLLDYQSQVKSGMPMRHGPYPIEFDDEIFDGV
jgi:hypothetical protein